MDDSSGTAASSFPSTCRSFSASDMLMYLIYRGHSYATALRRRSRHGVSNCPSRTRTSKSWHVRGRDCASDPLDVSQTRQAREFCLICVVEPLTFRKRMSNTMDWLLLTV